MDDPSDFDDRLARLDRLIIKREQQSSALAALAEERADAGFKVGSLRSVQSRVQEAIIRMMVHRAILVAGVMHGLKLERFC